MNIYNNVKGTIDLYNNDIINIEYLINKIKKIFILYGYEFIKTPSIENINIIKIIKNNSNLPLIYNIEKKKFLIFDLTIPLLRFCLKNNNKIIFPFKRFQIQKVWRKDNPQNNRYREFYQCDFDIIGFKSYFEELEIILLCDKIFNNIHLPIIFFINHIDILYGLCEYCKIPKKKWFFLIKNIDKLNNNNFFLIKKILLKKIIKKKINKLFFFFKKNFKNIIFLKYLKKKFKKNKKYGINGTIYLIKLFKLIKKFKLKHTNLIFKIFLSRGLNYYSKTIFEIKYINNKLSLGGGGRYDNIIKINNKKIKGIGLSLGLYRIYNQIKTLKINLKLKNKKKFLFINFGKENYLIINKYANFLRKKNIIINIYPYNEKLKKQIKYAIKNEFNYIIILGKLEINKKIIKIKNLITKKEYIFNNINSLIKFFNNE
ncbi:MAG: ATP phosphoribosyltransferase regulatory subunit [Candidatus Shikimatogenerans sp. JK-2022]|nr:ATP phosphoribosyltransferase regulatory subunit [Candidatus Shikimatogenerans bostrichidophilus]